MSHCSSPNPDSDEGGKDLVILPNVETQEGQLGRGQQDQVVVVVFPKERLGLGTLQEKVVADRQFQNVGMRCDVAFRWIEQQHLA